MGSHGYRRLRRWKSGVVAPLEVFNVFENIYGEDLGRGDGEGPTRRGGRALPLGHALHPCGRLVALLTCTSSLLGVFWSKKNHREGFIPFGIRFMRKKKTETRTGL